jgi:hypothetical protein
MGKYIPPIIYEGELLLHKITETYEAGDYSSSYEHLGSSHEESVNITVLGLKNNNEIIILAESLNDKLGQIKRKCQKKGISAQISYHVSNKKMTELELLDNKLKVIYGSPEADYGHHFSDLTGYLWTDEILVVNNHDIIEEIYNIIGGKYQEKLKNNYYLFLKIEFHKKD